MKVLYSSDLLSLDMKTASYIDISEYLCSKRTMDFSTKYQLKIRDLNALTKLANKLRNILMTGHYSKTPSCTSTSTYKNIPLELMLLSPLEFRFNYQQS